MARRRGLGERKLRTREHVLADLSANYVEKQALLCGFTAERVRLDYGTDLIVQTFNRRGEVEGGRILFQLKAANRVKPLAGTNAMPCRIDTADLALWLQEPAPVVLVLYDARTDGGYWLYLQQHFAGQTDFDLERAGLSVTVAIPRSNLLNRLAMRRLARAKNAAARQFRKAWTHEL